MVDLAFLIIPAPHHCPDMAVPGVDGQHRPLVFAEHRLRRLLQLYVQRRIYLQPPFVDAVGPIPAHKLLGNIVEKV